MKRACVLIAACGGAHVRPPIAVTSTTTLATQRAEQVVEQGDVTYIFAPDAITIAHGDVVTTVVPFACDCTGRRVWTSAASIPALDRTALPFGSAADRGQAPAGVRAALPFGSAADRGQAPAGVRTALPFGSAADRGQVPAGVRTALPFGSAADRGQVPAGVGDGRWIVATRFDGTLWRVTLGGELESIAERFGLGTGRIASIGGAGTTIALGLEHAIGVSIDGVHVARYPSSGELAVAHDRLAIATDAAIDVWDLARGTSHSFAIAGGHPAFLDPNGTPRLIVTTPHALWIETAGTLQPLLRASSFAATVAGTRLWVGANGALSVLDGGVLAKTDAHLDPESTMFGSPNGDLWIDAHGLHRYSLDHTAIDPRWASEVAPVFQRVCAHCHLPGGDADVDLSTPATWAAERAEIVRRVLVTRTMPPAGTELSDPDRRALEGWLTARP